MKKLFTILAVLFSMAASAQNTHTQSSSHTIEDFLGSVKAEKGIINGRWADTAAANLDPINIKNQPGAQIITGDDLWLRNSTATQWILLGSNSTSLSNGLLSTGAITLIDSTITIQDTVKWSLNGINYQKTTPSIFTINSADSGYYRRDLIYADTSGNLFKLAGVQDTSIAVTPKTPANSIVVTIVDVYGAEIAKPVPVIITPIPNLQQVTNEGNTTTNPIFITANATQTPLRITSDFNHSSYLYFKNASSGGWANTGFLFKNDVPDDPNNEHTGHFFQIYMGSTGVGGYNTDGGILRSNGTGGLKINADSGRIAFTSGSPSWQEVLNSHPEREMGAFELNGDFGLRHVDSTDVNLNNIAFFDANGIFKRGHISPVDSSAYNSITTAPDSSYVTWNKLNGLKDTVVILGNGLINGNMQSVTGLNTDNTDPFNPVVRISVDGTTITGVGTPGNPLIVSSVTDVWKKSNTDSLFKKVGTSSQFVTRVIDTNYNYIWNGSHTFNNVATTIGRPGITSSLYLVGAGDNSISWKTQWQKSSSGDDIDFGTYTPRATFHFGDGFSPNSTSGYLNLTLGKSTKVYLNSGNLGYNQGTVKIGGDGVNVDAGAALDVFVYPNHRALPPLRFTYTNSDVLKDTLVSGAIEPYKDSLYFTGNNLIRRRLAFADELGSGGYILPTASSTILGGVKVGSGLSIDVSGVLTAPIYTASNGLTKVGTDIELGGSLYTNAQILTNTFGLSLTGNPGSLNSVFYAESQTTNPAVLFKSTSSSSNPNYPMVLVATTPKSTTNGVGIEFDATGNTSNRTQGLFQTEWVDTSLANEEAKFTFKPDYKGTFFTTFSLYGTGKAQLNKYGTGIFTGTPTYNLAVNSNGDIIETNMIGSAMVANTDISSIYSDTTFTMNIPSDPYSGLFRVALYVALDRAATTSSTLPKVSITYMDGVVSKTVDVTSTKTTNATNSSFDQGQIIIPSYGTITITTTGYNSVGATQMKYKLYIDAEHIRY